MEETVKEELKALPSTSQQSASTSPQIESVESRLSEIESTLSEFAQSLDGKRLQSASQSLIAEAQKSHVATASATENLQAMAEDNQKLVSRVGGAVQRIEKRTEERVEKAVEQVVGEASATMTANFDASNERADRIIAATAKLEARQLWSAAAAMCLALLPVAVVIAGAWMAVAGLITGTQWALDVDGGVWLGIGRWLVVCVGLAGTGYALFSSVRWVSGLVEAWKGRGMPKWRS
ncbi:vacuolar-type H+-ATPase subunit I/STV1 [Neomicrococcus lactis]|uniref:Vacuolar-type H+-ATPase subunit I/STV1 n=1 Tax=Neomicrococcus lactis TaxID=732241 RepID=A0A7W9DBU8_9MICC|nr:vacuolar-type H+-ATPase subunit I/STV1 [Neomicrococcus lactis]